MQKDWTALDACIKLHQRPPSPSPHQPEIKKNLHYVNKKTSSSSSSLLRKRKQIESIVATEIKEYKNEEKCDNNFQDQTDEVNDLVHKMHLDEVKSRHDEDEKGDMMDVEGDNPLDCDDVERELENMSRLSVAHPRSDYTLEKLAKTKVDEYNTKSNEDCSKFNKVAVDDPHFIPPREGNNPRRKDLLAMIDRIRKKLPAKLLAPTLASSTCIDETRTDRDLNVYIRSFNVVEERESTTSNRDTDMELKHGVSMEDCDSYNVCMDDYYDGEEKDHVYGDDDDDFGLRSHMEQRRSAKNTQAQSIKPQFWWQSQRTGQGEDWHKRSVLQCIVSSDDENPVTGIVYLRGYLPYFWVKVPDDICKRFQLPSVEIHPELNKAMRGFPTDGSVSKDDVERMRNTLRQPITGGLVDKCCAEFKSALESALHKAPRAPGSKQFKDSGTMSNPIVSVSMYLANSLEFYTPTRQPFFKVMVSSPNVVYKAADILHPKFEAPAVMFIWNKQRIFDLFETDVEFALRFLIDRNFSSGAWLTVPANRYSYRTTEFSRRTAFEYEIDVDAADVIIRDSEVAPWNRIPMTRVISSDIECAGRKGHFPNANHDPVVLCGFTLMIDAAIGGAETKKKSTTSRKEEPPPPPPPPPTSTVCDDNDGDDASVGFDPQLPAFTAKSKNSLHRIMLSIVPPAPLKDVTLLTYKNSKRGEREMLIDYAALLLAICPDTLTGYNINKFDIPYILRRMRILGADTFFADCMGRIPSPISVKYSIFQSSGTGALVQVNVNIPGLTVLDMYKVILSGTDKHMSYTLNSVSNKYLKNMQKADLHHSLITPKTIGSKSTPVSRREVIYYCIRDCDLALELYDNRMTSVTWTQSVRVTGTTMSIRIQRGQQILTRSLLIREALQVGLLKPTHRSHVHIEQNLTSLPLMAPPPPVLSLEMQKMQRPPTPLYAKIKKKSTRKTTKKKKPPPLKPGQAKGREKYQGATVIEANPAYFDKSGVAVADYSSLYPSIMQANNLCYSTMIKPCDYDKYPNPKDWVEIPISPIRRHRFMKFTVVPGLMFGILERVLSSRKKARKEAAECEANGDFDGAAINNGRQLALKVCANSAYGYTGANDVPRPEIAESVTFFARKLLTFAARTVYEDLEDALYGKWNSRIQQVATILTDLKKIAGEIAKAKQEAKAQFVAKSGMDSIAKLQPKERRKYTVPVGARPTGDARGTLDVQALMDNNATYLVYGDTDSIFFLTGTESVAMSLRIRDIAVELINHKLMRFKYLKITGEKVYFPFLMMKKKRYGGLKWEHAQNEDAMVDYIGKDVNKVTKQLVEKAFPPKLDTKGGENVRRDNCPLVRNLIRELWDKVIIDENLDMCIDMVRSVCRSLDRAETNIASLVITKTRSKNDYTVVPAHVALAERIEKREPGTGPVVGDRIPYVFIMASKDEKMKVRAEDPLYAIRNRVPIDYKKYIHDQVMNPVSRLLAIPLATRDPTIRASQRDIMNEWTLFPQTTKENSVVNELPSSSTTTTATASAVTAAAAADAAMMPRRAPRLGTLESFWNKKPTTAKAVAMATTNNSKDTLKRRHIVLRREDNNMPEDITAEWMANSTPIQVSPFVIEERELRLESWVEKASRIIFAPVIHGGSGFKKSVYTTRVLTRDEDDADDQQMDVENDTPQKRRRVGVDGQTYISAHVKKLHGFRCIGCRAIVNEEDRTENNCFVTCEKCRSKEPGLKTACKKRYQALKKKNNDTWDACAKCIGGMEHVMTCANMDCESFFVRETDKIRVHEIEDEISHWTKNLS